jgi:hypothetical protein
MVADPEVTLFGNYFRIGGGSTRILCCLFALDALWLTVLKFVAISGLGGIYAPSTMRESRSAPEPSASRAF